MNKDNEPVLIIDDSIDDAGFAKIILKESGLNNVVHATNLNDAIDMLKTKDIRRVVLDLGGIVRGSSNPMATLDALEQEGIRDLQVVVLTGNKNPAIKEQVENRGYQCLTKDSALDLVENSTLLPEAIARLPASYHHADLKQDIFIQELFMKNKALEEKVLRLESLVDKLLLAKGDTNGMQEMALSFKFLDTRVTHIEVLRNQFGEISVRQDFLQQQLSETKNTSATIELLTKDIKHLTSLAEESQWIINISRQARKISLVIIEKAKEIVFKYIKIVLVGVLTTLLMSAPAWFPVVKKMPDLQKALKWAIENLAK